MLGSLQRQCHAIFGISHKGRSRSREDGCLRQHLEYGFGRRGHSGGDRCSLVSALARKIPHRRHDRQEDDEHDAYGRQRSQAHPAWPGSGDRDIAGFERYRPAGQTGGGGSLRLRRRGCRDYGLDAAHFGVAAGQNLVGGEAEVTGVDEQEPAHLHLAAGESGEIPSLQHLQKANPDTGGSLGIL